MGKNKEKVLTNDESNKAIISQLLFREEMEKSLPHAEMYGNTMRIGNEFLKFRGPNIFAECFGKTGLMEYEKDDIREEKNTPEAKKETLNKLAELFGK